MRINQPIAAPEQGAGRVFVALSARQPETILPTQARMGGVNGRARATPRATHRHAAANPMKIAARHWSRDFAVEEFLVPSRVGFIEKFVSAHNIERRRGLTAVKIRRDERTGRPRVGNVLRADGGWKAIDLPDRALGLDKSLGAAGGNSPGPYGARGDSRSQAGRRRLSDVENLDGVRALRPVAQFILHRLPLLQRPESLHTDGGMMDKNVRTQILLNEPIAFGIIEPFDSTTLHGGGHPLFKGCHVRWGGMLRPRAVRSTVESGCSSEGGTTPATERGSGEPSGRDSWSREGAWRKQPTTSDNRSVPPDLVLVLRFFAAGVKRFCGYTRAKDTFSQFSPRKREENPKFTSRQTALDKSFKPKRFVGTCLKLCLQKSGSCELLSIYGP